jgi:hypothetical protein
MEARGTKTWIVDASAAGQTGLLWRTNLGGVRCSLRPPGPLSPSDSFPAACAFPP